MTTNMEERARERAKAMIDLLWHIGVFVIISGFLWALDQFNDDRPTWAYWVTISWGIGLAFHVLAWFIDGRDVEARLTDRYLHELEAEESEHRRPEPTRSRRGS
jgi:hypothetical protein